MMPDRPHVADVREWVAPFAEFARDLGVRLAAGTHTTEDTVRYYFWNALINRGGDLHSMVPEKPHPHPPMARSEVDLWLSAAPLGPAWVEVKYDRPSSGSGDMPRTMKYGALLADFFKLAMIEDTATKIVLYVSTAEMVQHLQNNASGLLQATERPWCIGPDDLQGLPKTALKTIEENVALSDPAPRLRVSVVTSKLIEDHEAYLFQVQQETQDS